MRRVHLHLDLAARQLHLSRAPTATVTHIKRPHPHVIRPTRRLQRSPRLAHRPRARLANLRARKLGLRRARARRLELPRERRVVHRIARKRIQR